MKKELVKVRNGFRAICKCDNCGKEFQKRKSGAKQYTFCCRSCYYEWLKTFKLGKPRPSVAKQKIKEHRSVPEWTDRKRTSGSHIMIYNPEHPFCRNDGYVYEHRVIMEQHIGRPLVPEEVIHHINNDTSDNRIENLMLFASHSEHLKYHWQIIKNKIRS